MSPQSNAVQADRNGAPSARARTNPTRGPKLPPPGRTETIAPRREQAGGGAQVVLVSDLHLECSDAGETLGHAVSAVNGVVGQFGGELAAVLGTKVVATFPADRVLDAVGAAVTVQRRAAASAADDRWVAMSSVVTDEQPALRPGIDGLGVPVIGDAIDHALLLCQGRTGAHIFADESTASAASTAAAVTPSPMSWTLGGTQQLTSPGREGFAYREIEFDGVGGTDPQPSPAARRGRRPARSRAPERRPGARPAPPPSGAATTATRTAPSFGSPERDVAAKRRSWSHGRVCCWFNDRGRGVIASSTGQEFYVDRRFLVVSSELDPGMSVFFVPRDPVARGRNPVAGAVLIDGAQMEARIEHVDESGRFGFAQVTDSNGTHQLLLIDLAQIDPITTGEWLLVEVRKGEHGPIAAPV